jgi:hypothetical protein
MKNLSPREKWFAYFRGEDVGPMVAPLVDNWSLDIPYYWPYDEPEPFPEGHRHHGFAEQMAMAKICGYDGLFYCWADFPQIKPIETSSTERVEGNTRIIENRTETPFGPLTSITEIAATQRTVKPEVETEEDFVKVRWLIEQSGEIDIAAAVAQGKENLSVVGDKGLTGMWWGAPGVRGIDRADLFVYIAEFPELYKELLDLQFQVDLKRLDILRDMGYDFLFYCVDGTEWISPNYFEEFIAPYTETTISKWKDMGGSIVWHSCGLVTEFVYRGYYNRYLPEILETMSEPPVGNLPSLKWGRERVDPRIATKGNIDLQLLHDGPIEEIRAEVRRVKEETAGYRHIMGASDDILSGTPLENMLAFVDEARK